MFKDQLRDYLYKKIRREFLTREDRPRIPTDSEINREVEKRLKSSKNNIIGEMKSFDYRSISNPSGYVDNFKNIKNNVEFLMGSVYNETNRIIDQINNSTSEKNSLVRDFRSIDRAITEVEIGRLTNDGLSYTVSDNFTDLEKVDSKRSTTDINIDAGKLSLSLSNADQLQFTHYRSQNKVLFNITEGLNIIKSQNQVPGTSFNGIFKSDDTERWEYQIETNKAGKIIGYFTLKLSEIGDLVDINEIDIKLSNVTKNGLIYIEYLDSEKTDDKWQEIPGTKAQLGNSEYNFTFKIPKTTHIKVYFQKEWPDSENMYYFGINELIVRKSETSYESVFTSNSLKLEPYRREKPSITSASLVVDNKKIPGTNIKYFVGIDIPVAGKIVNTSNDRISINSEDAFRFVSNGIDANNENENYYIFASELRNKPWISGSNVFQNWEPNWQEITPVNDPTSQIPTVRYFNTTIVDQKVHDIYFWDPIRWGDSKYTGPWPASNVTWSDDWDGTPAGFPQSGFIWGESPFKWSGIWWGDGVEHAGWWRPHVPSSSGTPTWDDKAKYSTPDFIIPVYDQNGNPVYDEDGYPVQKHFWKIFKWPKDFSPIHGSIRLFYEPKDDDYSGEKKENKHNWNWNFETKTGIKENSVTFKVKPGAHYYTIKLENIVDNNNLKIIKNSITNLRFKNFSPDLIEDFFVDYGYDYFVNEDNLHERKEAEPDLINSHATITFADALSTYIDVTGDEQPEMIVDFKYTSEESDFGTWENYFYIPKETINQTNYGYINDPKKNLDKIIVQELDEYGIIRDSKELIGDRINKFNIPLGWSRIGVHTNVDLSQGDDIDSSIALWSPDDVYITPLASGYMSGSNNDKSIVNTITDDTTDFDSSGILSTMPIKITTYIDNALKTIEGSINNVKKNQISVEFQDPNLEYKIESWSINACEVKKGFYHSPSVKSIGSVNTMNEVDLYTLLHETSIENDSRFAICEDVDESKYMVVKTPNKKSFPKNIVNKIHYTRSFIDPNNDTYVTYTTGTSGNIQNHPSGYITSKIPSIPDLSDRPANTLSDQKYDNITTYGEKIQVNNPSASGFLFWDTAENLQSYYKIKYSVPSNNRPSDRIFIKMKLISDNEKVTPSVNNYSILVNSKEDIRRIM